MGVEEFVLGQEDLIKIKSVLDECFFEFNYELDVPLAQRLFYLIDTYSIESILSKRQANTEAIKSTTICEDLRDIELYFQDFEVYDELLKNPNLPSESIKSIYEQIDPGYWDANADSQMHGLLSELAGHLNTPVEILTELATYDTLISEPAAASAVLNPNLPIDVAVKMIKCDEMGLDFQDRVEEMKEAILARGYNPDTGKPLNPEPEKFTYSPRQIALNL